MKRGLLLDSHVLLWLDAESHIKPQTQLEIAMASASEALYMSDISLWELGVAVHKKSFESRPNLHGLSIEAWFRRRTATFGIRTIRIASRIAIEAAEVPGVYGYGDPGDCFLIATARIRNLTLVTKDSKIIRLAESDPEYLSVIVC